MNPALFAIPGAICYAAAASVLFARLWRAQPVSRRLVATLALLALAFHAVAYALMALPQGRLDLSFFDALSLLGAVIVAAMLVVNTLKPVGNLGIVLFPLAAAALLAQLALGMDHQRLLASSWQINLHGAMAAGAYAVLLIAAAQAVLLALQERALRRHQLGGPLQALPPLPAMETMLFQLIAIGFCLLTLALVTGAVFVEDLLGQQIAHKTVLSVLGWLIFGGLLLGRWRFGWRGRTAIRLTLAGASLLLLAYFGSKLVYELVLQRP